MSKALVIQNLKKTYGSSHVALKGINLEVEEGDFFALLGPNGAGKSTTIGIIASLVNKTAGKVWVFGYDIDRDFDLAKTCIGLVPQEFNFGIFERVIDIIINQAGYYGIPYKKAAKRAEYYLTKLGLWDKRFQAAKTLSGGMKRRLMIARALVHEPKMLILDEPTAGVDVELRRSMWAFLKEINQKGTTIILTTHYLEEAEALCRRVAIIHHGSILEDTTIKALLSRLHQETIVLDLKSPHLTLPKIPECKLHFIDETTLEVTFPKTLYINDIFAVLTKEGMEVVSMRNKVNRLEEFFLGML